MSVERVTKLLALAAQENEEGRTAAWQAARIIREKGYVVQGADGPPPTRIVGNPSRSADFWRRRSESQWDQHWPAEWPSSPPRRARERNGYTEQRVTAPGLSCWSCKRRLPVGEMCWATERRMPVCGDCV